MRRAIAARAVAAAGCAALLALPTFAQSNVVQKVSYGEVLDVREVLVTDKPTGTGARVGSTVGSVSGYALAKRGNRWLGALAGGAIGGAAGHGIEKASKKRKGVELLIKTEAGEEIAIQIPDRKGKFAKGDRVRLQSAEGRTEVVKAEKEKPADSD